MQRTILIIVASAVLAPAQRASFCTEPAEIRHLTLTEAQRRSANVPDDFFVLKKLIDLTPDRPKPGILAPVFERKL
jgi:hypothetical protein